MMQMIHFQWCLHLKHNKLFTFAKGNCGVTTLFPEEFVPLHK